MAETTDFISRIKVRDLISAYESKSNSVRVEFTRPRAKSVGNVLAKNVVVHLSEFNNLDDVEKALRKIETKLNFYEVYNKAKHVGFQEQLFNILTSIVNIESDAADATTRRKRLIAKTQTLVSFLNQKLPSNVNTVAASDPITYKYTPYSSYIKENGTVETKSKNISENVAQNQVTYSNSIKSVEITNPTGEPFVSVKKLKENFLPKSENVSDVPQKADTKFKVEYTFKVTKPVTSNGLEQEQPKEQHEKKEPKEEDTPQEDKPLGNISVSKLRNLFENKSEKNSKGLEIVTGDKSELSKPVFGGSASNINFPYTERNLGTFRLQRSVSGNYMNYTGLLNRIDINRTNSVNELNKVGNQDGDKPSYTFKNNFDEDSGADSDVEEGNEEQKIVGEVKENSTLSWEDEESKPDNIDIVENENIEKVQSNKKTEVKHPTTVLADPKQESNHKVHEIVATIEAAQEENVNYSSAKNENVLENENIVIVKDANEVNVIYSRAASDDPKQESDYKVQERSTIETVQEEDVNYSTAESEKILENENTAIVKGAEEIDVNYSTLTSDDIKQDKNNIDKGIVDVDEIEANKSTTGATNIPRNGNIAEAKEDTQYDTNNTNIKSFANVEEREINYSTVESKNILGNENIADLKGIEEVDVKYSTAVSDDIKTDTNKDIENVAIIEGVQEIEVNYSTAESNSILDNEKTATVKDVEAVDVTYSTAANDTVNHETQKTESEEVIHNPSTNNGIIGSENVNGKITSIEEEIDKIDVDQTLANEDIVLNAEDLKNADDEFEKLLASSETEKIST